MKKLINKIKTVFADTRGESLVESIASILIFTILMVTATMMIKTSFRITGNSTVDAGYKQNIVNKTVFQRYDNASAPDLILRDDTNGIKVIIPVDLSSDGNFTAFSPR